MHTIIGRFVPVQVFTFITPDTGEVLHFNASAMLNDAMSALVQSIESRAENPREAIDALGVDAIKVQITPEDAELVRTRRGVNEQHVKRMVAAMQQSMGTPIIAVHMDDGSTLTIDGHHRFLALVAVGEATYWMLRYRQGAWRKYLLPIDAAQSLALVKDTLSPEDFDEWSARTLSIRARESARQKESL